MSRCLQLTCLFLLCLGMIACNSQEETTTNNDEPETTVNPPVLTADGKEVDPNAPNGQDEPEDEVEEPKEDENFASSDRQTMTGRWTMILSASSQAENFIDLKVFILEIRNDKNEDGSYKVRKLFQSRMIGEAELDSFKVTDKTAQLSMINVDQMKLEFNGEFRNGIVWGNLALGDSIVSAARLVPTEDDSIEQESQVAPTPGRTALSEALSAEDRVASLTAFIQNNQKSPLALDAYQELITAMNSGDTPVDEIRATAEKYFEAAKPWGPRMEQTSRFYAGYFVARTEKNPELALELLDRVAKDFEFEPLKMHEERIKMVRKEANTNRAISMAMSDDDKERADGSAMLADVHQDNPFNPRVIYAMAEVAEKNEDVDNAMKFYSQLVILPQIGQMITEMFQQTNTKKELPNEALERLWKAKHEDNTDGLGEFNQKVYEESLYALAQKSAEAGPSEGKGGRVVLAELFTGAGCPPCVAADVALGTLERELPKTKLIALRYHLHTAGIDPLTNRDGETRSFYYAAQGTPSVFINGKQAEQIGGFLPMSKLAYDGLHEIVDKAVTETSDIKISLSAKAADGLLKINANVEGLDDVEGDVKLHVVLAEDLIDFAGRNGIRQHEMVVRSFVTPDDGLPPNEGKLAYNEDVTLADFYDSLAQYLADFEEGQGVFFPVKPLGLNKLHAVAFVQIADTREVLQAIAVPVEGELNYSVRPEKESAEKKDEEKEKPADKEKSEEKPAEEKPAAEKPAAEKPAAEKPAVEKPAAEKPAESKEDAEKTKTASEGPADK